MKNFRIILPEKFPFLVVKLSVYLNRRVFVMVKNGETFYGRHRALNNRNLIQIDKHRKY